MFDASFFIPSFLDYETWAGLDQLVASLLSRLPETWWSLSPKLEARSTLSRQNVNWGGFLNPEPETLTPKPWLHEASQVGFYRSCV